MRILFYLLLATLLQPHEAFAPSGKAVRLKIPLTPPRFSLQMQRTLNHPSAGTTMAKKTQRTPGKKRTLLLLASLIPLMRVNPGIWVTSLGAMVSASMKPLPLLAIAGLVQTLKSNKLRWNTGEAQKNKPQLSQAIAASSSPQGCKRSRSSALLMCGLIVVSSFLSFGVSPAFASATSPMAVKSIVPLLSAGEELQLISRLVFAAVSGAVVGWERSSSKHSAGVRTMALVSLGAAAFTICSAYGFTGDPSRMAANVASGVGFLGAGVITTQARETKDSNYNIVHGLTTAAAIWLSAALGVACGVGLYVTSGATALCTVAILRLGKGKAKAKREKHQPLMQVQNVAQYHPSDTIDTSEWDENNYEAIPPLMGNDVVASMRSDYLMEEELEVELLESESVDSEWLTTTLFENKTFALPELVHVQEEVHSGAQNLTNVLP